MNTAAIFLFISELLSFVTELPDNRFYPILAAVVLLLTVYLLKKKQS